MPLKLFFFFLNNLSDSEASSFNKLYKTNYSGFEKDQGSKFGFENVWIPLGSN